MAETPQSRMPATPNIIVRDQIKEIDGDTAKEALIQLTWLGVDPIAMQRAIQAAQTICRVIPDEYFAQSDEATIERMKQNKIPGANRPGLFDRSL